MTVRAAKISYEKVGNEEARLERLLSILRKENIWEEEALKNMNKEEKSDAL